MNLYLRKANKVSEVELLEATLESVYVHDLPDMGARFAVEKVNAYKGLNLKEEDMILMFIVV